MNLPKPDKLESRICFGIVYFKSEEKAEAYAKHIKEQGYTYNGGFMHGKPCGRDKSFDYVDPELGQLYAVTQ